MRVMGLMVSVHLLDRFEEALHAHVAERGAPRPGIAAPHAARPDELFLGAARTHVEPELPVPLHAASSSHHAISTGGPVQSLRDDEDQADEGWRQPRCIDAWTMNP